MIGEHEIVLGVQATSSQPNTPAAILKIAHRNARNFPDLRNQLLSEGRYSSRLQHPNFIRPLDMDENESGVALLYENLEGTNFARLLERLSEQSQALPFELAAWFTIELLRALSHLHRAVPGVELPSALSQDILLSNSGELRIATFTLPLSGARSAQATAKNMSAAGGFLFQLLGGEANSKASQMHALGAPEALIELGMRARRVQGARFHEPMAMENALMAWLGTSIPPNAIARFINAHTLVPRRETSAAHDIEHLTTTIDRAPLAVPKPSSPSLRPPSLKTQVRFLFHAEERSTSSGDHPTVEMSAPEIDPNPISSAPKAPHLEVLAPPPPLDPTPAPNEAASSPAEPVFSGVYDVAEKRLRNTRLVVFALVAGLALAALGVYWQKNNYPKLVGSKVESSITSEPAP